MGGPHYYTVSNYTTTLFFFFPFFRKTALHTTETLNASHQSLLLRDREGWEHSSEQSILSYKRGSNKQLEKNITYIILCMTKWPTPLQYSKNSFLTIKKIMK